MPAEKETGASDVTDFGCAAMVTGFLVDEQNPSRPDCTDGELRTSMAANRLCSDALVLRPLEAARTTTTVDYKRGADVNRLRNDVFVLRVLRCLTFEVSWRQRRDALDSTRKMGRRPSA